MATQQTTPEAAQSPAERCGNCRFWLAQPMKGSDCPIDGPGWGWCRRLPPTVSDHLAMVSIHLPRFGQLIDPEDVAGVIEVAEATLFPATFNDRWCGEYRSTEGR
jgi:hypothetical protein